jgi:hypothetical protein
MTTSEATNLWGRSDLAHLDAAIKRVTGTLVSIALPPPHEAVTVRWPVTPPSVGEPVVVACQPPPTDVVGPIVHVCVVQVHRGGTDELVVVNQPKEPEAAPAAPPPPRWLDALVAGDLLPSTAMVTADLHDRSPVQLLMELYDSRAALDRGFVYYDRKWRKDSVDPVADFAAIAEQPEAFALRALELGHVKLDVRLPGGQNATVAVPVEAGDLDALVKCFNRCLGRLNADRRIYVWDTGNDALAFLGRAPADLDQLRAAGVPLDGLRMPDDSRAP